MIERLHRIFERVLVSKNVLGDEKESDRTTAELAEVNLLLEKITRIMKALENGDTSVSSEAEELLAKYGPERRAEMQTWCSEVLSARKEVPSIAHQRPIIKMKYIESGGINNEAKRQSIAEKFGFHFESFSHVLDTIDFWKRIGPALEKQGLIEAGTDWSTYHFSIQDKNFPVLVNAFNGGAPVDYESLFPEAQYLFSSLKQRKFHLTEENAPTPQKPSTLSVPDILTAVALEKLLQDIPTIEKERVEELCMQIIDDTVSNDERTKAYQELDTIFSESSLSPKNVELAELLNTAGSELGIPENHPASLPSVEAIREKFGTVDAVVVLKHFDLARAGYIARSLLHEFPEAFAIPSGMFTPHEMKEAGASHVEYTEADETIAWLLMEEYADPFAELPHMPKLPEFPPINPSDILIPDEHSIDTTGNAQHVARRLNALSEVRKRPLNVVILTTNFHGSRAFADFRSVIPQDVVPHLGVYEYKDSPPISNIGTERKIVGIMDMFCEYAKRLYMVATQK